ncbi:MAG: acylneuraminate cytidylyltransferase family protein [Chlorobiaceae bacterium]|nr:acylneuraminate cytidylyltransferase family protein [Chlorobiaceae bacterium]
MKILALILARGGSKRLPGKNIRLLGGKPLIVWSIDVAKDIPDICNILVSTDDKEIESVCKDAGAIIPWLRPAELATDTASSVDAALHALDWYQAEFCPIDGLLLLQPTSPFRSRETVLGGIELFKNNSRYSIVGVSQTHTHPMWTFKMEGGFLVPFINKNGLQIRSQDLPKAYVVNGGFYLISPDNLKKNKSFFGDKTIPLVIESQKEFLDIDTEFDFQFAEFLINQSV